jgi:hypothetical protein
MGSHGTLVRAIWLLTGITWAAASLILQAHPDYWDPVTTLDYAAIVVYSAAWLTFAPSTIFIGRLASLSSVVTICRVIAAGAVVAGASNLLEDGLNVPGAGTFYILGFFAAWLGLLVLAWAMARAGASRVAALVVVLFLGIALLVAALGGVIVLAAFIALAARPSWFLEEPNSLAPAVAAPAADAP